MPANDVDVSAQQINQSSLLITLTFACLIMMAAEIRFVYIGIGGGPDVIPPNATLVSVWVDIS